MKGARIPVHGTEKWPYRWDEPPAAAMEASLNSLHTVALAAAAGAVFALQGDLQHILEREGSVFVLCVAPTADETVCFVKPTEEYLADVAAAVARYFHQLPIAVSEFRHGWPILSVVGCTPTVTEAGEATSLPGGGRAR